MADFKSDREQLLGILNEFSISDVQSVIAELQAQQLPSVTTFSEQGTAGKLCEPGEDGFIGEEQFLESGAQEAIWGEPNFLSAHFLTEGAEVQKAIAMVTLKETVSGLPAGNGWGTGFMVSDSLFMTNNHVIPSETFCDKVNMQFLYQDGYGSGPAPQSEFFETDESSFFHTNAALDYTIVRLKRKPYLQPFPWRDVPVRNLPRLPQVAPLVQFGREGGLSVDETTQRTALKQLADVINGERQLEAFDIQEFLAIFGYTAGSKYGSLKLRPSVVYPAGLRLNVIQHPQGRKKEVTVQQNKLVDAHTNVIHYKSDTDYGSSGSPVFNNTWDLVALHRARNNAESANEGVRIDKIVADLRSSLQGSNPAVLDELGI